MIQRIQTIYLLLAFLCAAGLFFMPVYSVQTQDPGIFNLMDDHTLDIFDHILLFLLALAAALLSLINIFLFRNRKLQIAIGKGVIWSTIIFMISTALFLYFEFAGAREAAYEAGILFESEGRFRYGVLLPFLVVIFAVLAVRNIRKDEALVRSTERLI